MRICKASKDKFNRAASVGVSSLVEPMERRLMMSTTTNTATGAGYDIEYTGEYGSYMPVGSGGTVYNGFSSFGFVNVPVAGLGTSYGIPASGGVSSLSLQLYNTAVSGKYAPAAGNFGVYVIPTSPTNPVSLNTYLSTPTSPLFLESQGGKGSTDTDISIIGTASGGPSTLGVTAADEVGTFAVTASLPLGYTTFTLNTLGSDAQAQIASDINNNQPIQLAIVSEDNTGHVDWNGTGTGQTPLVSLTVNPVPLVSFSSPTFSVSEADTVAANHSTAVVTVTRTANPSATTILDYSTSDGTLTAASGAYTPASGQLTFAPGVTSQTFNINFKDLNTTTASGTVNVTLSDDSSDTSTPVFPVGGTTATVTINYIQATDVALSASSGTVDEAAGTTSFTVTRTGSLSSASTVQYTTSDGAAYAQGSLQSPENAVAGRDYTATSGTINFNAGQGSATVTVPILDVQTFPGTRVFNFTLSNPSTGTALGSISQATETITDDATTGTTTLSGMPTASNDVETGGPYAPYANEYNPLQSTSQGGDGYAAFPEIDFGSGSSVIPSTPIGTVESIKLSIYNLATTGSYGGVPGDFDVYVLTNSAVADGSLAYSATGATGTSVFTATDQQADPVYIGTAYFPNNQVGYNDYVIDNIPTAGGYALSQQLGTPGDTLRLVLIPSSGSPVRADFQGDYTANQPILTVLAGSTPNYYESFSLADTYDTVNKGTATETVTVDRSGTDISDTASVGYTTSDGTAVAGDDYTATTGVLNFNAGQGSATINIPLLNPTSQYGDKYFNVTLTSAAANGTNHIASLVAPTTDTVTIVDTRTTDILQNADLTSTIETTGPVTGTNAGQYVDATTATEGTASSYAAADYNDTNSTDGGDGLSFSVPSTVGTINEITVYTINAPDAYTASGPVDVYLVSNYSTPITSPSPLTFSTSADPVEGLGTQLGTKYLLGTINFSSTQATNSFTGFPLTNASSAALAMLANDLNTTTPFRIVFTPENGTVEATWAGDTTAAALTGPVNPNSDYEAPVLGFNYTAAVANGLPAWVSPSSQATFSNNTLTLSGPTTIIGNPANYSNATVAIVASGSADQLTVDVPSGSEVQIGSLSLTGGATATLNQSSGVLLATTGLTIDSTSQLDLGNGFLDVAGASLGTINALVAQGYSHGTWTGDGITSSVAAVDHTHLTALGVIQNNQNGNPLFTGSTTFDGTTPGASDILVRYTYYGDTNLDGKVDGSDYTRIDSGLLNHATGWFNGDFNYDGFLNGSDYTLIDNACNTQGPAITAAEVATPSKVRTNTAVPLLTTTITSDLFSQKKIKHSLIDDLESQSSL